MFVFREDGFIADVFQETVVMPTYLLAFAVCDFKYLSSVTQNWTVGENIPKKTPNWNFLFRDDPVSYNVMHSVNMSLDEHLRLQRGIQ